MNNALSATDPETGVQVVRPVTAVWVHEDVLIDLETDGEIVTTTEDHPFWNATDQEFQEAQHLESGELLLTAELDTVTVRGLVKGSAQVGLAYNLTIADLHTYHVGIAEILVHNTGPDCGQAFGDGLGDVDFHGSEYTLDEYVEFAAGHTGDEHLTMGRPSRSQIEATLRGAGPQLLPRQNSSVFNRGDVRVIVNWDKPWRSTSYFPGS